METKTSRITQKIEFPSDQLSQILQLAVFDEKVFSQFSEDPAKTLANHGLELDLNVKEDALVQLRSLVVRAHEFAVKKLIDSAKFEAIFGFAAGGLQVAYSEECQNTNRGKDTSWENQDAVPNSGTKSWHSTEFNSCKVDRLRPEDRFLRVPLLDALTLGAVIAKMDSQLKAM